MSKSITSTGLTIKQQAFVDAYQGNIKDAAVIAGLSEGYCARLMMDVMKRNAEPSALAVQAAIRARQAPERAVRVKTRQQRQEYWSNMIDDPEASEAGKLRASELLGKSEGDFLDVKVDATPQSLADIAAITQSRKRKRIASKDLEDKDDE